MGRVIEKSLISLGYVEPAKVKLTEAAKVITERTGRNLSKQRLKAILKADNLTPDTLEWLARGLDVSVAELMSGNPKKKSR